MLSRTMYLAAMTALNGKMLTPDEDFMHTAQLHRGAARAAMLYLHRIIHTNGAEATIQTPTGTLHVRTEKHSITISSPERRGSALSWKENTPWCGEFHWQHVGAPHLPDGYAPWEWAYDALCR